MKYLKLGKTDIKVSAVAFGAWAIGGWLWGGTDEKESMRAIDEAISQSINFIDTAPAYGEGYSEEIVGKSIKGKRDKLVIATKCGLVWHTDKGTHFLDYETGEKVYRYLGPESVKYEVEQSLKRLGTDYIDLYQTHWQDHTTPIEDTMEALLDLKKQGKIRAIGACNATLDQIEEYNRAGQLDVDQEKYSLLDTEIEHDLLPWCKNNSVTLLAYGPMARGLLTGKIGADRKFKGDDIRKTDPRFLKENREKINKMIDNVFRPMADGYGITVAQLSVASLISQDGVGALCGTRNISQARENAQAGNIEIASADIEKLKEAVQKLKLSNLE